VTVPTTAATMLEDDALELDFEVLCLAHGPPLTDGPAMLRELLGRA
jgi:hypothetical protein